MGVSPKEYNQFKLNWRKIAATIPITISIGIFLFIQVKMLVNPRNVKKIPVKI